MLLTMKFLVFLFILGPVKDCFAAINLETCRVALGMQTKEIKDEQLSSSSTYSEELLGARYARLGLNEGAGAWCPGNPISKDHNDEFLEINLLKLTVISLIAIQGRDNAESNAVEYATHFKLVYFRQSELPTDDWRRFEYRNYYNYTVMLGNNNPSQAISHSISPPIIAERVRVYPVNPVDVPLHVCMRVELYGCPYQDDLQSYSMPQGNAMDEELVFTDRMYDGVNNNGILKYGLGQLTDGKVADNYYDHMDPYFGKGYHWVGWDRQATPQLEITFRFDSVRNFTSMMLHCNNQFDQGVSLFASVVIWFSVKGGYYSTNSLRFTPQRDDTHPDAKHLNIELNHNIGETVKCQFEYYSRWIMFSEVSFESSFMTENYTVPSSTSVPYDVDPMFVPVKPTTHPSTGRQNEIIALSSTTGSAEKPEKIVKPAAKAKTGLIGGLVCLVIIIAILIGVILILLWRQKQNKSLMKGPRIVEQVHCDLNSVRITNNQLGTQHSRRSNPTYDQLLLQDDPEGDVPWVSKRSLPEIPPTCVENSGCSSRIYAEPDITKSTGHSSKSNFLQQPYAETDVIHKFNIQGVSGNNIYSVPSASLEKLTNLNPVAPEINMEDLEFLEVLGDGQFGQVHLCEIENHELLNGNGANKQTNILVAVKMLRKDANKNARSDFMTEIKIMSQLHHDNIVRLLGKCTKEEPWCMIVEYMPNGDLNQFLFDRDLDTQINGAAKSQPISFEDLIYIVKQITDGMQYLSSLNFVHRDLATRNCLVGQRYRIRIADFGMSRSLYSADYYKIEGKAILPIRWMAWESILYGKFSTNSDVWAYGVTLWEIFTLAKEQPYSDLTDQQVIENTGEYYRNTGEEVILDRPSACPKDIYCYMKQCWRRDTETRPTFDYLDGIFQQKNDGYEPEFED